MEELPGRLGWPVQREGEETIYRPGGHSQRGTMDMHPFLEDQEAGMISMSWTILVQWRGYFRGSFPLPFCILLTE